MNRSIVSGVRRIPYTNQNLNLQGIRYSWRVGGDCGCFLVIPSGKQLAKLRQVQIISTGEISTAGELYGQGCVAEGINDVRNDVLFRNANAENLTLSIDTDDAACCLVIGGDEDGLSRDTVHVYADARFEVVEVNKAVFGDEEDDAVPSRNLHCNGEVIGGFGREENINGLLLKGRIGWIMINLDNMQLARVK